MANLGALFYELHIKNLTDQELQEVEKKLKNLGIELDTKKLTESLKKSVESYKGKDLSLGVKQQYLHDAIRSALKQPEFPIKVTVNKAKAQDAVREALRRAGLQQGFTASDKRQYDAETKRLAAMTRAQASAAASNALAQQRLARAHNTAASAASGHTKATVSLNSALRGNLTITKELGGAIGAAYSVVALKNFMTKVVEIGGELEQQKLAMKAILGDEGMANTISSQINTLAVKSPFGVMELNQYAKQLTAFQIPYNELYDTMKRMADVSAAVGVDMGRIILAYGQVRAAKFLKGCLGKGTLVTMCDGSQKKVEDIAVGDVVMGDDEQGRNVLSLIRNREMMYAVKYEGGSFRCNENHILTVYDTEANIIADVYVLEYLKAAHKYKGVRRINGEYTYFDMTVERDCVDDYYGFEIDGNNRFIIEDGVVTHNTELRQFTEANIPLIDMLAERFTKLKGEIVSAGDIMEMISKKEISFEDVKAVLWELTGEGGRFYNMQEVLSESVKAKWKNLADAIDLMFADIAESTSGPLKGLAELLTELTTRWKTVGTMATTAIGVYGGYRIAILAANKLIAANNAALFLNSIAVGANVTKWQWLKAKAAESVSSIGASIKRFILSTKGMITVASVGAGIVLETLTVLWQRHSEAMQKAKEIGDNIFTKATEGADNLAKQVEKIKPASGLKETELTQGIEQMQQAIKDYSPTPIKDINDALYTQEGLLKPIEERYEALKKRLEELKVAFDAIDKKQINTAITNAIKDSKKNIFHDDVNKNAEDYANALSKREAAIRSFAGAYPQAIRNAVRVATQESETFRKATQGMATDVQKVTELIKNIGRYGDIKDLPAISNVLKGRGNGKILGGDFGISTAQERLLNDMQIVWRSLETDAAQKEIPSIRNAVDEVKEGYAIAIEDWINSIAVPDEVKQKMFLFYSDLLGFDFETYNASQDLANNLNAALETKVGKVIANKVRNGLQLTTEEQQKIDAALKKVYSEMFRNASDIEREALNDAVSKLNPDGGLVFDSDKLKKIQVRLDVTADWDAWKRELNQKYGGDPEIQAWIKASPDYLSFMKAVQNGYKEAQTAVDKLKPVLVKAKLGFDFEMGELLPEGASSTWYMSLNETQKKNVRDYNKFVSAVKKAQTVGKTEGFDPAAGYNKGGGKGTEEDEFAEAVKERIKLLKNAKSEYESLAKSVGTEAVSKELAQSPIFAGLKANKFLPEQTVPKTLAEYEKALNELQEKLTAKGLKTKQHRELNIEIEQVKLYIKKKKIDDALKLALDKVSKEAERQLADWNLFDKIRKATGNEELAMSIGFGLNADAETDYPKLIEQQLGKQAKAYEDALVKKTKGTKNEYTAQGYTYQSLKDLYEKANAEGASEKDINAWLAVPEELRKSWEKSNGDILKYFDQQREAVANILNEYQTLQDKIDAINAKRKANIEVVEGKNQKGEYNITDENERKRLIGLINSKADWDIFRQGNDYLRFFSTIYSYTLSEAQNMGMLIEQYLNQQLQDAQISAEEYGKEMERIRQQIEKLRNVKSPFMSILTGGVGGYLNQQQDILGDKIKADPKLSKELFDYRKREQELTEQIAQAQRDGDKDRYEALKKELQLLKDGLSDVVKSFNLSEKFSKILGDVNGVMGGINNIVQGVSDAFNSIKDMADAYGFDTESDAWLNIGAVVDTFSQVSGALQAATKGDIGGIISGTIGAITAPFTIWSKLHDKKLQKMIERSKEYSQQLQYINDAIERRMGSFLGNAKYLSTERMEQDRAKAKEVEARAQRMSQLPDTWFAKRVKEKAAKENDKYQARVKAMDEGGAYGYQRQLMTEQLAELEKQRQAEIDKKKTDNSVVADYDNQIDEMKVKIQQFAEETANAMYGIDLAGWAEQIGDALVDAFAKGEDAAEAFDKTVGDIMRSLVSKMISTSIIAPMFEDLKTALFGKDGKSGWFGDDFELQPEEAAQLGKMLQNIKKGIGDSQKLYDQVNELLGGALDDTESKSGLSAGIQGITEDTGDLVASYLNGIRGDVSVQTHDLWPCLLDDMLPQMNIVAESQLRMQEQIAENTRRNAVAAEAILKSSDDIYRLFTRVTQGGAKIYVH